MLCSGGSKVFESDERVRTTRHVAQVCCRVDLTLAPVILRSVLELDQRGAWFMPDVSRSAQRAVGGFSVVVSVMVWGQFRRSSFAWRALPFPLF